MEGISPHSKWTFMYNVFFMTRRLITTVFIIVFNTIPLLQLAGMIFPSVLTFSYLIGNMPFKKAIDNWIEIFNEITVLVVTHVVLSFINPLHAVEIRVMLGWFMIISTSFNIATNLIIVLVYSSIDIYNSSKSSYTSRELKKDFLERVQNKRLLLPGTSKKEADTILEEYKAYMFCQ